MSTNYYAIWDELNLLLHVGKTGAGHISLQALEHVYEPEVDGCGRQMSLPDDWTEIRSWRDWLQTFANNPGYDLVNEYGVSQRLDELDEFFHRFSTDDRRHQWRWVQDRRNEYTYLVNDYWLDEEDFSMCRRDFF